MGKYDLQRIKPPTVFVLHQSVSPEGDDWRKRTDQQWKDWFNTIGRGRTYAGYTSSEHYEIGTNRETFSAVPICLVPNGDGSSLATDTWRIVDIFDWYNCIGWHAGNWDINRKAVGMETYGRWDAGETFPDNACKCAAKWIRENIEARNGGKTNVMIHREITATACPGTIADQRNKIVDMVNNPQKYDNLVQVIEEDPKMIAELQQQIKNKDLELEAKQGKLEQVTKERDFIKDESDKFREKSQNEYFKLQKDHETEIETLKNNYKSVIDALNNDDSNEDAQYAKQIIDLKAQISVLEGDKKSLEEQLKTAQQVSIPTVLTPIVTGSNTGTISLGEIVDKDKKVSKLATFLQSDRVQDFLHHSKLITRGTAYAAIAFTAADLIVNFLNVQIPTEWTFPAAAGFLVTCIGIVYRVYNNNKSRFVQTTVTEHKITVENEQKN